MKKEYSAPKLVNIMSVGGGRATKQRKEWGKLKSLWEETT